MKSYFFYAAAVLIPLSILCWLLYKMGQSLLTSFDDWRLGLGLGNLKADRQALREQLREENEKRLETGCDHDFEDHGFGLPPDSCSKCGLEREKPSGPCDHVWKLEDGPVPGSKCEKCGEMHDHDMKRGGFK